MLPKKYYLIVVLISLALSSFVADKNMSKKEEPVYIHFGPKTSDTKWNALPAHTAGSSIADLKDQKGNVTGVSLRIVKGFNGRNKNGEKETKTTLDMPELVSLWAFYGNPLKAFQGKIVKESVLKFSGLDKNKKYDFCFYGSRSDVKDKRESAYAVKGANEVTALLDAANNTSNTACANAVQPNNEGEITITITAGPNNNNAYGFYYINALKISSH
ncbi:hypothetical protein G5B30_16365 [Sphingobacterium sp. SGG-5]|uniref:hypothetical protein n=1 Tax=Sphingobacterium sp. SGG-5 TaxID=2710881 RepID=UPI0013EB7428|nr:hypothetical protein [Sphingobacterium sp. SGG-5]NGM63484.1 hypothetical protein [Sphingobacterium sp. SGG-5]